MMMRYLQVELRLASLVLLASNHGYDDDDDDDGNDDVDADDADDSENPGPLSSREARGNVSNIVDLFFGLPTRKVWLAKKT